jgi:hypothetical protein
MGIFDSVFSGIGGPQKNPANEADKYYRQVPDQLHQGYDPYVRAGTDSMGSFQEQLRRMSEHPTDVLDEMGGHYEQSPGYQNSVYEATKAANNAASASGRAGSPASSAALAKQIAGYSSNDFNNYIDHSMGVYNNGVNGLGSMTDMGFRASTGLADSLANNLMSEGNLRYAGQVNSNQRAADNRDAWMTGIGTAAGMFI